MNSAFEQPQRQSITGIVLIFAGSLFRIVRNFWFLGVYLLVQDPNPRMLLYSMLGFGILLVLALIYSIRYYLNFLFHIDLAKKEFVLQKGVFVSNVTSIPFERIQQVNFSRDLLQRVVGVYSVRVDTAGSKEKEVEIMALTKEKADSLAEELMALSTGSSSEITDEFSSEMVDVPRREEVEWEYSLGFWKLLKIGLTTNYLRGLALLFTFYIWLQEQFRFAEERLRQTSEFFDWEFATSFGLVVVLLFLGMGLTVAETFIKYYGLQLKKRPGGLQVEMGLRDNTKVSVKARRVQLMQVFTNPVQKLLNLNKIKISLGSSQDDLERDQISIPGMPAEIVEQVRAYFYGEGEKESGFVLPHKILLYRNIFRSLVPLGIGLGVLAFSQYALSVPLQVSISLGYVLLALLYQFLYHRNLKLAVSENFLVKYSGVWTRKKEIIEAYKLQAVSVSQPLWYKSRGIVNLTFHSAGGDLVYRLVNKSDIMPMLDYVLYKIEASQKPWM